MKAEQVFSKDGFYTFVLETNLMLHRNVAERCSRYLAQWLADHPERSRVRFLDLACGGAPVSVAKMLASFPSVSFAYTGVDINPDQINAARQFQFSENVCGISLHEGNAWDFADLNLDDEYDIVFSGMNLHHGTPEEILYLFQQCRSKLAPGGVLLSHDFYRPSEHVYLRRPSFNPNDPAESFAMVSAQKIERISSVALAVLPQECHQDWRQEFVKRYASALLDFGASQARTDEVMNHVLARDYPVSVAEATALAREAGLSVDNLPLSAEEEPLGEFFALLAFCVA